MKNLALQSVTKLAMAGLFCTQFTACTVYTNVNILKPVDIQTEDVRDVKNVLILNRTAVPKGSRTTNVLEGIITGESITADKNGAAECVKGLQESLIKALNYKTSNVIPIVFYGGETNQVPMALPWKMVDSLCKQYNADMLVSLEYFDSDAGLGMVARNPGVYPGYGTNTNNVSIKTVWRTYKPVVHTIIDEHTQNNISNNGGYKSPYPGLNHADKYNTTVSNGYWAGISYGFRISEQWVVEGRRFFKGGNQTMRHASKLARFSQWDEAFALWSEQAKSMSPKIRARALHNMAVYKERTGDLEAALDYAQQSFSIKHYSYTAFVMGSINKQLNNRSRLMTAGIK